MHFAKILHELRKIHARRDEAGHELNVIFLEAIFPVSMYLTGLFTLFAVLHPFVLSEPFGALMTAIAGLSAVASATLGYFAKIGRISVDRAYLAGYMIFALGIGNSAVHMWVMADMDQSTNFALVFVAVGLFFLSMRHLLTVYAITYAIWLAIAFSIADTEHEIMHFAIMNFQATVIGVLAMSLRVNSHRKLIRMRADANVREEKLADALAQARLYAAAERENRAKTEFLANMSHELRTPLNAIIGFSEMMWRQMFGPLGDKRYAEYANNIMDAGQHLLSLVNDILDLSRIQLDVTTLHVQTVDVRRVCENCIAIVRERATRAEINLSSSLPPDLPLIETDERRLKQILINLLSNAVKFTPARGSVTIDAAVTADRGVMLRVIDTGIGMTEDEIHNATKPFWQADAGLARNYEGTGLGLALSQELSRALQAEFVLKSRVDIGTVASLKLPPKIDQERPEESKQDLTALAS